MIYLQKQREKTAQLTRFSENDCVFLEVLKSDDCHSILANCSKNIQEEIEELFVIVRKNNGNTS